MKDQKLTLTPNIEDPDTFYAELIALQSELNDEQTTALYSKLLLILANHIGDMNVLREAFRIAKSS